MYVCVVCMSVGYVVYECCVCTLRALCACVCYARTFCYVCIYVTDGCACGTYVVYGYHLFINDMHVNYVCMY